MLHSSIYLSLVLCTAQVALLGRVLALLGQLRDERQLVGSYEAQLCGM